MADLHHIHKVSAGCRSRLEKPVKIKTRAEMVKVGWMGGCLSRVRRRQLGTQSLVSAPGIEIDNRQVTIQAVELARDRNMDFADALLALQAAERGERVCTFDESDFRLLLVEWMAPE
jgi:predicted nucleic acid-binding protein